MQSVYLKFYLTEKHHHHGGYGRHGHLHEDNFFELAGDLPVQVEFVLDDKHANQLLGVITAEGLDLPYVRYVVETGTTGPKK